MKHVFFSFQAREGNLFDWDKMNHPALSPVGEKQREVAGTAWWELGDCCILIKCHTYGLGHIVGRGSQNDGVSINEGWQICFLFPESVEGFRANL